MWIKGVILAEDEQSLQRNVHVNRKFKKINMKISKNKSKIMIISKQKRNHEYTSRKQIGASKNV